MIAMSSMIPNSTKRGREPGLDFHCEDSGVLGLDLFHFDSDAGREASPSAEQAATGTPPQDELRTSVHDDNASSSASNIHRI